MARPPVLGVNFGQSYASIAVIDKEGHPLCIANEDGERQIACAISYAGEEVYIGNGAMPHLVKNGKNTIMGFRNLLGHTYDEVDHTAILTAPLIPESKTPAYTVDILLPPPKPATPAPRSAAASGTATPNPAALEPVPSRKTLTVPEVTTLFLSTLFQSATDFLGARPENCVISAPTWFTSEQREALKAAAEGAGMKVLQVLDEAAAVLVGYRVGLSEERKERGLLGEPEEGDAGENEKRDKRVVVLDMGETSLGVSVIQVADGEYTVLAKSRDDKLGGREFDDLLLKHFAKEFTKKTKVDLELPCGENASAVDKRAEAKLLLAVEHTKRSLSASSGAATCAVESLKDGMDLSTAINRLRFDGLASPVYSKVGQKMTDIVSSANLELAQIDEVLLAGSSTLFPGLQQHLALLLPPTTPVTTTIDPSEVIAIGCVLTALHLSSLEDGLSIPEVLAHGEKPAGSVAKPIGIVIPGQESEAMVPILPSGAPLPARRRVVLPVTSGVEKVGLELWEGKDIVKVDKVEKPTKEEKVNGDVKEDGEEDEDDEDDEEEEDEETKTPVTVKEKCLGGLQLDVKSAGQVLLEVIVQRDGGITARLWEQGEESEGDRLEM